MNMTNCLCYVFCLAAGLLVIFLHEATAQRIRGVPGVDYPNYRSIPKTSFKCSEQRYVPGFYADMETDCQVFHFCYKKRSESFLCPAGTIFNQAILACDSWFNSNCSLASMFYVVNAGPGLRNAGKNIPMLLRLRDRAQGTASPVEPSTSAPEPPVTEQKIEEIVPITEQIVPETKIEDKIVEESKDPRVEDFESSDEQPDQFDSEQGVEDEASSFDNFGNDNVPIDFSEDGGELDLEEDPEQELMHDVDQSRDVAKEFHPGPDYKEAVTDQFQNFYGVNPSQMHVGQRWQAPKQKIAPPTIPSQFPGKLARPDVEDFSKRLMPGTVNVPRRNRRKPTYVVVDEKPEFGRSMFEATTEIPVSTEGPFTEPISLDTLVELNTELPDDFSIEQDHDSYDEFEGVAQEMEDQPEVPYFDPSSEIDNVDPVGYSEQDRYDIEGQDDNEQFQAEYTTEYLEPSDEFIPENFDDQSEVYSEEETEEADDIVVYDDTENQQAEGIPAEKFVVIPDETDFPTTEASDIPETSDDGEAYGYQSESGESDDIYIVNDSVEGQPGYRYQVMQEGEKPTLYDPQAGYGPYGVPGAMPGGGYGYRAQPGNINYGRMPNQGYDYGRYPRYPQNYYQYVDQYGRPLNPQYVDPTSDHMPEDPTQTIEPDDLYEHGVYGDTYENEDMQAEGQSEEVGGQYVYNPDTGYYHGPDGRIFSSDGVEIQGPMTPDSTKPIYSSEPGQEFLQHVDYPDQPDRADEPVAAGEKALNEDLADFSVAKEEYAETEPDEISDDETYDVTESGLLRGGDGKPKDDFIVVDEEGETDATNESEYADEASDFSDLGVEEESAEESFIDEKMVSKDNKSDSARAGDESHGVLGDEDKPNETPVPEAAPVPEKDPEEKSGLFPPETEDFLSGQSTDFLDTVPQSPVAKDPIDPFSSDDFLNLDQASSPAVQQPVDPFSSSDFLNPVPPAVPEPMDLFSSSNLNPASPAVQPSTDPFSSAGFSSDFLNPVPQSPAINPFSSAGKSGSQDFMPPSETQFMNMGFQNPMDFGPYGFGPNMRQQFGMLDASSKPPVSSSKGTKVRGRPVKSDPLSFQNTMKTMKRGKFGMFKKMMMKNN